jgi:hypothetical protein
MKKSDKHDALNDARWNQLASFDRISFCSSKNLK